MHHRIGQQSLWSQRRKETLTGNRGSMGRMHIREREREREKVPLDIRCTSGEVFRSRCFFSSLVSLKCWSSRSMGDEITWDESSHRDCVCDSWYCTSFSHSFTFPHSQLSPLLRDTSREKSTSAKRGRASSPFYDRTFRSPLRKIDFRNVQWLLMREEDSEELLP